MQEDETDGSEFEFEPHLLVWSIANEILANAIREAIGEGDPGDSEAINDSGSLAVEVIIDDDVKEELGRGCRR